MQLKEMSSEINLDAVRDKRVWMAVILGSLSAIGPLSIDMYLPSLPMMTNDLSTTASLTQLSLTACLLGLSLGQLLAGPISDRRGRRLPLMVGLLVYSIASLLCALVSSIGWLIIFRFIQGVAGASGIVICRAIVRDLYTGTELTKFFSLLMLVNGAAPILAPIIGGQLLQYTTWHGVFIVLALSGAAMLMAVFFGLPETLMPERRATGGIGAVFLTFFQLLKDRLFFGYALSQSFVTAAMFAYISGSSYVLQNIYAVTPQQYSYIFALNGVGIILASQLTGRLAGKVRESTLLTLGIGLAAFSGIWLLVMILVEAGLLAVLVPLFLVVSCVGIVGPTTFSLAMQNQGQASGSAAALLGLLPMCAGAAVAPLVGLAGSMTALPMGLVIAGCNLAALLSYVTFVYRRQS